MQRADILILANTIDAEETRVAIVEDGRLSELFVERMWEQMQGGEIYKARVESIMRGMNAAFVTLGDGRNGFLYLNDARGVDVREGGDVLVQVAKTARKNKGPRVTARISLPGRYLVLIPGGRDIGVSKRIVKEEERARLKRCVRSLDTAGFGVILRTASEGVDETLIALDLEGLKRTWAEIQNAARRNCAPCLLYKDIGLLGRVLRDELTRQPAQIVVDNQEEYDRIAPFLARYFAPDERAERVNTRFSYRAENFPSAKNSPFASASLIGAAPSPPQLTIHRSHIPLFEYYDIEKEIDALLDSKVWLPSGAYLVIETTEALTVIDVNTGKFTGGATLRDTVLATNLEAAEEIARQLKLRAIGGIVVVDFIDMEPEEDKKTLLALLDQVFAADRCRVKVYGISPLGLVEITRKRARADLRSVLTRPCPVCGLRTYVYKEDSVAIMLKRFIRKVFHSGRAEAVLVSVSEDLAAYVAKTYLLAWEEELGRRIFIRGVKDMRINKFRLDLQGSLNSIESRATAHGKGGVETVVYRTADP